MLSFLPCPLMCRARGAVSWSARPLRGIWVGFLAPGVAGAGLAGGDANSASGDAEERVRSR
jgi:hypothetical protein